MKNFIKMLFLSAFVFLIANAASAQGKVITKKVLNTENKVTTVTMVNKTFDEITSNWISTGNEYTYNGKAYPTFETKTGKTTYILIGSDAIGWRKIKVN